MKGELKWSLILALSVTLLSAVVMIAGDRIHPLLGSIGSIGAAILINLVVIFLALRESPKNPFGKQVIRGVLIGAIGGVLVFVCSWLLLSVVFPEYIDGMRERTLAWMEASGMPRTQLDQQARALEQATPLNQAFPGLVGTFVTSTLGAALIGIFVRRR